MTDEDTMRLWRVEATFVGYAVADSELEAIRAFISGIKRDECGEPEVSVTDGIKKIEPGWETCLPFGEHDERPIESWLENT